MQRRATRDSSSTLVTKEGAGLGRRKGGKEKERHKGRKRREKKGRKEGRREETPVFEITLVCPKKISTCVSCLLSILLHMNPEFSKIGINQTDSSMAIFLMKFKKEKKEYILPLRLCRSGVVLQGFQKAAHSPCRLPVSGLRSAPTSATANLDAACWETLRGVWGQAASSRTGPWHTHFSGNSRNDFRAGKMHCHAHLSVWGNAHVSREQRRKQMEFPIMFLALLCLRLLRIHQDQWAHPTASLRTEQNLLEIKVAPGSLVTANWALLEI